MTLEEFEAALAELGWKAADFCRITGLHRNTPSRWRSEGVEPPRWVGNYLRLTLELQRLHKEFVVPPSPSE
jgi:hypothetical protein